MENIFNWQFNTLPGNANQGSILLTRNDIINPPFNQSDFVWKAMEDVIGVADVKFNYDENENKFNIYKAKGHLNNENEWVYDYTLIGSWAALTNEVVDELKNLIYVNYDFEQTTVDNITTLQMFGIKKDGTTHLITEIVFVKKEYVDNAIANLKNYFGKGCIKIDDDPIIENRKNIELLYNANEFIIDNLNQLKLKKDYFNFVGSINSIDDITTLNVTKGDVYFVVDKKDMIVFKNNDINSYSWFTEIYQNYKTNAIEIMKTENGLIGKLLYDDETFEIASDNLKSKLINDTMSESDLNSNKHTYSIPKILQLLTSIMRYKGQVATVNDLPQTGNVVGDCWNVADTGDNYAWDGTKWDKLSGEYIAGSGIQINGKVISSIGISFVIGRGLQTTGAGSTQTLFTKNGNGIFYDDNDAIAVKNGTGITVNANGVNVNTGSTTKTVNNNIEVDYKEGLTTNNDGKLKVNVDEETILINQNDEIETKLKIWTGTVNELPSTEDPNTLYLIHE